MAQGSSGPVMKPFQKIRKGADASGALTEGWPEPIPAIVGIFGDASRVTVKTKARLQADYGCDPRRAAQLRR